MHSSALRHTTEMLRTLTGSETLTPFCFCVKSEEGPVNAERYLTWANAFLVVYSIDNRQSFEGCQRYLETLALHNKTRSVKTPIILLGNKLDMDRYR